MSFFQKIYIFWKITILLKKTGNFLRISLSGLADEFWIGAVGSPSNVMNWLSSGNELAAYRSGSFEYYGSAPAASPTDCVFARFAGIWVSISCTSSKGYACEI